MDEKKKTKVTSRKKTKSNGDNVIISVSEKEKCEQDIISNDPAIAPKKRGRKPKGGKIIDVSIEEPTKEIFKPNIILHLRCSRKDLEYNGNRESDFSQVNINSYSSDAPTYHIINNPIDDISISNDTTLFGGSQPEPINNLEDMSICNTSIAKSSNGANKDIWKKLKSLEHLLHINNVPDSNAACFWCTYEFDNPPVYIPKMFLKNSYHVYGCYCSPECATAYLMNENLDSSSKFERYSFLNTIYNSVYGYTKNIKPAPDPHYLLDKFFGNLTIQEYRALLQSDRLFLVVDKPITRILPELHEDNDEFIINNKIIPTASNYQVKRKLKSTSNKVNPSENFGIFAPSVSI